MMLYLIILYLSVFSTTDTLVSQSGVSVEISDMDVYVHGLSPEKRYEYATNSLQMQNNILSILNMNLVYDYILKKGLNKKNEFLLADKGLKKVNVDLDANFIQKLELDESRFDAAVKKFMIKKEYFRRLNYYFIEEFKKNGIEEIILDEFKIVSNMARKSEKRKVSMITLKKDSIGDQAAKEYLQLLENGKDFSELALEISDDPSVSLNSGDLSYFTEKQFKYPFAKRVFNQKSVGIIPQVFEYKDSYYIVSITEITNASGPNFEEFRNSYLKQQLPELAKRKIQGIIDSYGSSNTKVNNENIQKIHNRYLVFKED